MELKFLFIEDDETLSKNLKKIFDGETISGYQIKAEVLNVFEEGIEFIKNNDFDLVILDLYKDKEAKDEEAGIKVLNQIRQTAFIPVIFFTGHAYKINNLISEIVGVVSKGDVEGIDALTKEIERIIASRIALIKTQIYGHLKESLRKYFWETVDADKKTFIPQKNDTSLGYLLLRRFANSLSKESIKQILGDDKIDINKVHPMEFYIYPVNTGEYEAGEILSRSSYKYVLLTPSCDYILRTKKNQPSYRDVGRVLLARVFPLSSCDEYKKHKASPSTGTENNLKDIIRNKRPRFFFLPGTPFIENSVIDFQNKTMVEYEDLNQFEKIAKLDDPFAQSMVTSFIRYYNRIGFPDIDSEYIIQNL